MTELERASRLSCTTLCTLAIYNYANLTNIIGFNGDDGKNDKHGISMSEAEQLFFNDPLLLLEDAKHSQNESRIHALGKTNEGRMLHITFTLRKNNTLIRVVSAKDIHKQ